MRIAVEVLPRPRIVNGPFGTRRYVPSGLHNHPWIVYSSARKTGLYKHGKWRLSVTRLSRIHDEDAQGLIEFALISMTLLIFFLGIIDFSRFLYYDTAISDAARVGAETAIQRCAHPSDCGSEVNPVSNDFILWTTYCEANSDGSVAAVRLVPSYTNCKAINSSSTSPTCSGTCSNCVNDICISPDSGRTSQSQVTITVGYSFKPVSFLMSPFFHNQACYSGDDPTVNHHTICYSAVGRLF
jgi:TadE-like protein